MQWFFYEKRVFTGRKVTYFKYVYKLLNTFWQRKHTNVFATENILLRKKVKEKLID